ncbi:HAD family hydrolase, partial [Pseudomonas syringae pv. tagetis]
NQRGPIKAVIFDMDGQLLDTEGDYTEVTHLKASRHGRTFDCSIKQHTIGRGARDFSEYVIKAPELPMSIDEYLEIREPMH